jgi:hypothetical protein
MSPYRILKVLRATSPPTTLKEDPASYPKGWQAGSSLCMTDAGFLKPHGCIITSGDFY